MRRYGPLIVADGLLAVGDPGREHLRLMPDGILHRSGADHRALYAWDRLSTLTLDLPTTTFRFPGLLGTVGLGILTVAVQDTVDIGPDDDGAIDLVIDGEPRRVAIGRHHVGGYWVRSVDGAQRLLDHLLANPAQRVLLEKPGVLLDLAAKLARRKAG